MIDKKAPAVYSAVFSPETKMEISQKLLALLLLVSFIAGILAGLFRNLLSFLRDLVLYPFSKDDITISTSRYHKYMLALGKQITYFLGDFLFSLFCGFSVLMITYFMNDGIIRIWSPLGLLSGYYVYRVTFGRFFDKITEIFSSLLWNFFYRAFKILSFPFVGLGRIIYGIFFASVFRFFMIIYEKRKIMQTEKVIRLFKKNAEKTFSQE